MQRGEQRFAACGVRRQLPRLPRDELALIDQIDVAAQRRAGPCILSHPEPLMRGGHRRHAHLAVALCAIDRRDPRFCQPRSPFGVDQDHELGDELVDRRAASTLDDPHALVVDVEVVVHLQRARRLGPAAPRFEHRCELPQQLQLCRKRYVVGAAGEAPRPRIDRRACRDADWR